MTYCTAHRAGITIHKTQDTRHKTQATSHKPQATEHGLKFDEAVEYMSGLVRFGWKLDLDRMTALCERLGSPQVRYRVVHVAGTKGKGSTTALCAAILGAHGFRVGGYFSPYVYDVRERVQVDGEPIPRGDFARVVTQIRPHIEALAGTELGQTTEFELKTAVAFIYFAERGVDFACIEVGIGGDHTEILGDTYAAIAAEKAGILKAGVPCVTATAEPSALAVIESIAEERGVPITLVRRAGDDVRSGLPAVTWTPEPGREQFGRLTVATSWHTYTDLAPRMGGAYQRENAACAIAAAETALATAGCEPCIDHVRTAVGAVALPGRLTVSRTPDGPLVVLDGAHNALAADALRPALDALRREERITRTILVVGMVGGHAPDGVLAALAPGVERIIACQPAWKRAQPAEEIAAAARAYGGDVRVVESVPEAVASALAAADGDTLVLVTGSFYTVGEVPRNELI